uniref:Hypothetical epimerase n=1 Tax=Streptomyces nobilis TaxID=66901 RepID=I2CME9_9ACTN|nr:hypothetical epimerase [Streptomyces nobilis]
MSGVATYRGEKLETIIAGLRAIPSVEIIRIGSRFPVLLPQRITPALCAMLERYHPVWLDTHANHPREVTPDFAAAVDRLLRHGVPVGNQTVLLKGINDDVTTMRTLMTELLRVRVRPYYLYHCDNGSSWGRTAAADASGRARPAAAMTTAGPVRAGRRAGPTMIVPRGNTGPAGSSAPYPVPPDRPSARHSQRFAPPAGHQRVRSCGHGA